MVLGTSRGGFNLTRIVDAIERHGVGADDIMRGAATIHREVQRQRLAVVVAGIPKTVENTFHTAVEVAQEAIAV
uniref:Phosphofructokinase domain-containing protein n=1 Tax=Oryza meridionalis TaxID=40149 RepID=A0A0E0DYU2_9ORYZ